MFQNVLLLRIQDIVFSVHNNTTLKRSQFLLDWLILCAKPFGHVHCEFGDMSRCGSCYSVNCKLCSGFSKHFYLEVLSGTMLQRPWLVFRFLNKLSAACALGKPLHRGGKAFFIVLIGMKTHPGLIGCNIHNNNNKKAPWAWQKSPFYGRLCSEHRFSFWCWIHTQRYICEKCFTPSLKKPSTMFFICQKHFCSMCSLMDNSSHKLWGKL